MGEVIDKGRGGRKRVEGRWVGVGSGIGGGREMARKVSTLVSLAVLGLVAALVVHAVAAQPQGQLGGPRAQMMRQRGAGMLRMACNIEGLWAELSFGAKLADAKLLKMRPVFQKAWDERQSAGAEIASPADIPAAFEKLDKISTDLVDSVKKGTTEEEFNKLSPWLENQNRMLEMMRQRLSGSGAFMGPRPPQEQ